MEKIRLIKAIYVYIMMIVGIALIITGIFNTTNYVVKKVTLNEYPINTYEYPYPPDRAIVAVDGKESNTKNALTDEEKQKNEDFRQSKQVQDLTNAIVFLLVGTLLYLMHSRMSKNLDK
ncbi:MAG: hypothetical protein ACD_58C00010G0006 [uncultured bacterium]|nr:MAG: hypothetical protein ACD_58C00010G0006 [uncultured bacterium]